MSKMTNAHKRLITIASIAMFSFYLGNLFLVSTQAAIPNNSTPVLFPLDQFPVQVNVGQTISYQLTAFDPDNDPLTYSLSVSPAIAGLSLDANTGQFIWAPNDTQTGVFNIDFNVSDGIDTATIPVSITVAPAVQVFPPIFDPIPNKTVIAGQNVSFQVNAVSQNGLPVTIWASLPQGATFDTTTNTFSWTPDPLLVIEQMVAFTASDGQTSNVGFAQISVIAPQVVAPPVINSISDKKVTVGNNLSFTVSASSPGNLPLTISASSLPQGANFDSSTNNFSWNPTTQNVGKYTITFTVSDGTQTSSTTVNVEVVATTTAYQQPIINKIEDKKVTVGSTLKFTVNASSPTNLPLKWSVKIPDGARFDMETKTFKWTPSYRNIGTYYATFKVSDGIKSVSRTVKIEVRRGETTYSSYTYHD